MPDLSLLFLLMFVTQCSLESITHLPANGGHGPSAAAPVDNCRTTKSTLQIIMQNEVQNKLHYKHLPDEAHSHHDIRCQGHSVLIMICMLVLQEGESQLLIIIPPNTPLLQNSHAIRVIQLGPAAAVCPSNRSAHANTSVIVLNDRPFCTSNLNCQPLPVNLHVAGNQQHWIAAHIYRRHCDVVNQSLNCVVQLVMPGCCNASHVQHNMQ